MNLFTGNRTILLNAILTVFLSATGMIPYLINLVISAYTGNTKAAINYGFGVLGIVVGFIAAILIMIIGLTLIFMPLAIVYTLWQSRRLTHDE